MLLHFIWLNTYNFSHIFVDGQPREVAQLAGDRLSHEAKVIRLNISFPLPLGQLLITKKCLLMVSFLNFDEQ